MWYNVARVVSLSYVNLCSTKLDISAMHPFYRSTLFHCDVPCDSITFVAVSEYVNVSQFSCIVFSAT